MAARAGAGALSGAVHLGGKSLYALSRRINSVPSLYLSAGAIHGCVLCQGERPLIYPPPEDLPNRLRVHQLARALGEHAVLRVAVVRAEDAAGHVAHHPPGPQDENPHRGRPGE